MNIKSAIKSGLPKEIRNSQQFCLWKYENRLSDQKPAKIPYVLTNSQFCKSYNLQNLSKGLIEDTSRYFSYETAHELIKYHSDFFLGLYINPQNKRVWGHS
uniref:Uncharacterized protein n=1 Tax=Dichotomaria marginata TaxID=268567 RepID=A0A1G4NSN5_9FLOR|nr:Hypothetical protein ORF_9 [Dichotomaria marginata]SCW21576.1 Hypothetical protein ORF_9 [Dichotomaria marginata]